MEKLDFFSLKVHDTHMTSKCRPNIIIATFSAIKQVKLRFEVIVNYIRRQNYFWNKQEQKQPVSCGVFNGGIDLI